MTDVGADPACCAACARTAEEKLSAERDAANYWWRVATTERAEASRLRAELASALDRVSRESMDDLREEMEDLREDLSSALCVSGALRAALAPSHAVAVEAQEEQASAWRLLSALIDEWAYATGFDVCFDCWSPHGEDTGTYNDDAYLCRSCQLERMKVGIG